MTLSLKRKQFGEGEKIRQEKIKDKITLTVISAVAFYLP
jgi:hypothetical protein